MLECASGGWGTTRSSSLRPRKPETRRSIARQPREVGEKNLSEEEIEAILVIAGPTMKRFNSLA